MTDATPLQLASMRPITSLEDVVVDAAVNSSVALSFHRMVVADVLVMSRSSLSQAAGLLRTAAAMRYESRWESAAWESRTSQITLFPGCWRSDRRRHPAWRDYPCYTAECRFTACQFYTHVSPRLDDPAGAPPQRSFAKKWIIGPVSI